MDEQGGRGEAVIPMWPSRRDGVATGARVRLLGPVRIEVDGVERSITARRQRAVLACLALRAGEAVSADRLLDDVWGDDQPDSGVRAVAYQISKLRSLLEPERTGEGSLITTTSAGYVLDIESASVDVYEFDRLVDLARDALANDPSTCQALIERALLLWRGRPFADLGDEAFVDVESRRLEGRHLLARRTLAEARMAQGRHGDVIDDLEVMSAEHPFEEAVVQLLMTSLHRSGRTADALRAYGDLRIRLGSEMGIEPSGQLRQLEQQLLTGDDGPLSTSTPGSSDPALGRVGNLPTPLSSFVGRTEEIREICELLSTTRLVSLLSFGGVGKTRLAIEVAANLRDRFDDGAWFVDLVPITEAVLLGNTFIAGVGLPPTINRDPDDYLISRLATRKALIVVDNCEHLADDVGHLVARIVRAAPNVRVLATSRVRLGVPDEVIWQVQPLAVATSAFELFSQRARLVRPGFVVDDSNHAVIEQICERLDGIPLAIELASARLKAMTVSQIADHLDDRFRLLTRADLSADTRQRSMVATMSWSYDLLDDADRELLRRLSVFTDGFTLEAATVIGNDTTRPPATRDTVATATADVLDGLDRLVDAGLITFVEADGTARYRMLETVRDFAAGRLDGHDRDQLGLSHATYYSTIAARIGALRFEDHEASVRLGDQELGNLRAAMTWAYANAHYRLGMSIASNLWRYFWEQASGGNENVRWGRTALELIDDDDDDVLLVAAGTVIEAYNLGDRERGGVRRGTGPSRARRGQRPGCQVAAPGGNGHVSDGVGPTSRRSVPRRGVGHGTAATAVHRHPEQLHRVVVARRSSGRGDDPRATARGPEAPRCAAGDGCEDRGRRRRVRGTLGRSPAPDRSPHRIRQVVDRPPSVAQRGAVRARALRRRFRSGPTAV